ncbi:MULTISPECIES: hypothetical protein [unclassified Streptomyces]|uniref:hypothetical protein n=1 Tax=unclassified Streptomyces TaxID=2593676 RepID=UPI0033B8206B
MTAPLTPHDQPPPFPPYPGAGPGGGDGKGDRPSPVAELGRAALVAVAVTVCGVFLGLLWAWLSPRVPLISDGKYIYLKDTEGEEAIGGDGTFVLIALCLGALTALGVFLWYRRGGVAVVLGLAVGGVLASLVGWRLGIALGPTVHIKAHAKEVGPNVVFDGPLKLRAKSALVAWSAAAMLVHLGLTSLFGPRDPQPVYVAPQPWGAPPPPPPPPAQ